MTVGGVW